MLNQTKPRVTDLHELMQKHQKEKFPEPPTYKLGYKLVDQRTPGQYHTTEKRSGYLEEIEYLAELEPPAKVKDKNYKQVDAKFRAATIYPPSPAKAAKAGAPDHLGPTTYDVHAAFTGSQLPRASFRFAHEKRDTQIVNFKKSTSHLS